MPQFRFRLLPWEYGVRNLFRRPARSALTLGALTLVVLLVFVVVGFIRGLETTLAVSGDPRVVLIRSLGASEAVEISSIDEGRADAVINDLKGRIQRRFDSGADGVYASKEVYLGTYITTEDSTKPASGLARGITPAALLVRRQAQIIEGRWPSAGEVLVGRLAATKLGRGTEALRPGRTIQFEGRSWTISGTFAAQGSALEAEVWCPLKELQQAMVRDAVKRDTIGLLAITLAPGVEFGDIDEFCKDRLNLELQATRETDYYAGLQRHYWPVRVMAWLMVALIAGAGVFAGLNTMYGAVVGRVRELATLQTIGFLRRAIALSLVQEGMLLAAAASLIAAALALVFINGLAVRITMGAFVLRVDSIALLIGCSTGLLLGMGGAIPPAARAMRLPVAEGLKAI
jgi:ABC-type lipoprotein release transport system permease subunit